MVVVLHQRANWLQLVRGCICTTSARQHVAPGGFAPAPVQNPTSQQCKVQNKAALLGANFLHQLLLQCKTYDTAVRCAKQVNKISTENELTRLLCVVNTV